MVATLTRIFGIEHLSLAEDVVQEALARALQTWPFYGVPKNPSAWIGEHAKKRPRAEIIAWNNKERDLHLSDLPLELQEYMEDYIQQFVPRNRVVHHWFDVYDLEEERL